MRKFKNATETLDALEEQISKERKFAIMAEAEYRPTLLIVALYRLVEMQIDFALETGHFTSQYGSFEQFEAQKDRFDSHRQLGQWITEQPG